MRSLYSDTDRTAQGSISDPILSLTFHIPRMVAHPLQILYCARPFALCQASMLAVKIFPFTGGLRPLAFRPDRIATT